MYYFIGKYILQIEHGPHHTAGLVDQHIPGWPAGDLLDDSSPPGLNPGKDSL